MADEPDHHTLALLREMRAEMADSRREIAEFRREANTRFDSLEKKVENIRRAHAADSLLGRYAVVDVEERLEDITQRLEALEAR